MHTIYRVSLEAKEKFEPLTPVAAEFLNVNEKQIESWMAIDKELLFTDKNAVMIIAQEVSGELMADILAVDSQGNLIIIEVKRHSSDRNTIGQILDYAARLSKWTPEDFNRRWKQYRKSLIIPTKEDLFEEFKDFVENDQFNEEEFLENRRLYILASSADENMKRIITWLRNTYNVPIDFVPFQFYSNSDEIFLELQKIEIEPISVKGEWGGDWFFNTNETHSKGAYRNMLKENVIALFGYKGEYGKQMLDRPEVGQRVFAYVNEIGIIAYGVIIDEVSKSGNSVFGMQDEKEFHREVEWKAIVNEKDAVNNSMVGKEGYHLPVRSTLCKMYNIKVADWIAENLEVSLR